MSNDVDPYMNDPFDGGAPVLKPGFRKASVGEIRRWKVEAPMLRRLMNTASEREGGFLVMDDVHGGTAWKRNQDGYGGLVVHADVLEEALKPH